MKRTSIILAASAASVVNAASGALAAPKPEDFIASAIQGDSTEIAMGQLAQQKGSTQQMRSFGQMLADDHTTAKQEKTDLAKQLKVSPPEGLKPEAAALQAKLSGLSGMAFDRAFADAMVDDHQKDIADYQEEANADRGPAGVLAGKQLPTLQKHLQMALDIRKSESAAPAGQSASAAEGFLQQEGEALWRGSKFVGVNIYGPNDRKVGDIKDVLVDRNGKITHVVVGVGGFLGIGEKDVAIPFEKVNFAQEPMPTPRQQGNRQAAAAMSAGRPAAAGTTDPNLGNAPAATAALGAPLAGDGAGSPVGAVPAGTGPDAMVAQRPRSMAYPDHGTIDYTADQLKSAPTFSYAK